jgi:acylphosphatase
MLDPGILRRGQQTELRERLTEKLNDLVGSEAIMELVQELQDTITELLLVQQQQERQIIDNSSCDDDNKLDATGSATKDTESDGFGRRWIWAHHITNGGRCKSIVQEAKSLQLGGFLKSGYPGIVVVEGTIPNCNEFVQWIKGSKSRPGGFGRNWGHHVKGEINHDSKTAPCLPDNFQELSEDMAVLGAKCKEHGLETEFREYVLQHKNQV